MKSSLAALLVVALCGLAAVNAASSGRLAYCDANGALYGKGTSVMPWVQKVANTTLFTIRSADGLIANDPTSYTPGKLNAIHIRTLDVTRNFIGLVLYAVDSTGAKVGSWTIPSKAPFQIPPACDTANGLGTTITHADADLKALHVTFWFTAPVGTGKVTFKILIKQGEQNKGWFFYPAQVLSLTEATVNENSNYVLASIGQTCTDACAAQPVKKYCDALSTVSMRTQNTLNVPIVESGAACQLPLLSGCTNMAPFRDSDSYCYYKTDLATCTARTASAGTDTHPCTYVDTTGQRFCACTDVAAAVDLTGTIPVGDDSSTAVDGSSGSSTSSTGTTEGGISGALTTSTVTIISSLLTVLGALVLSSSSSSSRATTSAVMIGVLVVLALAVLPATEAHNWVGIPSRATIASVTKPCQQRIGNQPHVQVAPGQRFQMEWSVGHGDSGTKLFYWIGLHSANYSELYTVTTAQLDEYIRMAPTSAWKYNATLWQKRHLTTTTDPDWVWGYFDRVPLAKNDTNYIARDSAMNSRRNHFSNNNFNEYLFYPNHTQQDARVEYLNPKYPWIESVHRFRNSFAEHNPFAHQYDMANFVVPARNGPGEYIYHFMWGGYRDCVDVNVQPTTVTNRYGIYNATAVSTWFKVEHCEFYFVLNPITPCTLVPAATMSAKTCLDTCMKSGSCTAVQSVRLNNLASSLPLTVGIPFAVHNWTALRSGTGLGVDGPCGYASIHTRTLAGCTDYSNKYCNQTVLRAQSTDNDDQVCFGFSPYRDQDFQAVEDFFVTEDALDPRFYSTCWLKVPVAGFINVPTIPTAYPKWDVADQCISCAARNAVQAASVDSVANWRTAFTTTCVNCDIE